MEKLGKHMSVLLTPEHVWLIQTPTDADGACVVAKAERNVLFLPDTYTLQAIHKNMIAFECEIPLLTRVFKSAFSNDLRTLDVRLVQRTLPEGPGPRPFLSFRATGSDVQLVQDLPISGPLRADAVDTLHQLSDEPALDWYVDLHPHEATLQGIVDRLKGISGSVALSVSRTGDLHLRVHESGLEFGAELQGLPVLPQAAAVDPRSVSAEAPAQRLHAARGAGLVVDAVLQSKMLARALAAVQITQPAQLMLGVPPDGGCLHMMPVYRNPMYASGMDDSLFMLLQLPVSQDDAYH